MNGNITDNIQNVIKFLGLDPRLNTLRRAINLVLMK